MIDTIAAIATAPGVGGIGIVRISGPYAKAICKQMIGWTPPLRKATYAAFKDAQGQSIDTGIALRWQAPGSFTGEDSLELQGHGGPVVLNLVLERVLQCGARLARPGEFSQRAFLNGRLDLAQAEAIADLIGASTREAAISAQRSLQGALSERVMRFNDAVIECRAGIEASLDFPDDADSVVDDANPSVSDTLPQQLSGLREQLQQTVSAAQRGRLLRDGINLVLAGAANVGKSSLLNQLAGDEVAIVTSIAGTTRDPVQAQIAIEGVPVHVIDTAGIRIAHDSVERLGIERTHRHLAEADVTVVVEDDTEPANRQQRAQILSHTLEFAPRIIVRNKIDQSGSEAGVTYTKTYPEVRLCALSGEGVDRLRQTIADCLALRSTNGEDQFIARTRHLDALSKADAGLHRALNALDDGYGAEIVAEELRFVHHAMAEITGEVNVEELLERIFSEFCIGK